MQKKTGILNLQDYCDGKYFSKESDLIKLRDVLNIQPYWLLVVPNRELHKKFNFRTRAEDDKIYNINKTGTKIITESNIEIIKNIGQFYIAKYLSMANMSRYAKSALPFLKKGYPLVKNRDDVQNFCKELRKEWGINTATVKNLFKLLKEQNINIIGIKGNKWKADEDEFCGMSIKLNKQYFIFVNSDMIIERQRFTVLHELGHLILNFAKHARTRKKEKLCNTFASGMLCDSDSFDRDAKHYKNIDITLDSIIKLKEKYGISARSVCYKLLNRDMISRTEYNLLLKKVLDTEEMLVERFKHEKEVSSRFEDLVYISILSNKIMYIEACYLLNILQPTYTKILLKKSRK